MKDSTVLIILGLIAVLAIIAILIAAVGVFFLCVVYSMPYEAHFNGPSDSWSYTNVAPQGYSSSQVITDSQGSHTYRNLSVTDGPKITLSWKGDIPDTLWAINETSEYYTSIPALRTKVISLDSESPVEPITVTMPYDPKVVTDPENLVVCYLNETVGMYLPLDTQVDITKNTVTCTVPMNDDAYTDEYGCMFGGFDGQQLADMYVSIGEFNKEALGSYVPSGTVTINVDGNVTITVIKEGSDGKENVKINKIRVI